ncbi:MAG: acyltransferase [Vampirovibrio sp.]|nr:acyltransferase [Vampirovibrio sp.]
MIHSLTGLRFYAALMVFISHLTAFGFFMGLTEGPVFDGINRLGPTGVALFFVLSGFVLFINYFPKYDGQTGDFPWKKFYVARFARIYPVFFLTTLLVLPIIVLSPRHHFSVENLLLTLGLAECYSEAACTALNIPGWTISVEALFYVLFPLLGLLFLKNIRWHLILFSLVYAVYLAMMIQWVPSEHYTGIWFPPNRVLEFLTGMGLGYLYLKNPGHVIEKSNSSWRGMVLGVGFLLLLLQPVFIGWTQAAIENLGNYERLTFLYLLPPSALIIWMLAITEKVKQPFWLFHHQWIILGGEISYSFYLIHHLIYRYTKHAITFTTHLDFTQPQPWVGVVLLPTLLGISCIAAYWLYKTVELPWRKKILNWYHQSR